MALNLGLGLGLGRGATPSAISDLFNGFNTGSTFTGGPTVVKDYLDALVSSPAGVPAIEGGRLATTVADGATVGPDIVTNGDFSNGLTGWVVGNNGVSIVDGEAQLTTVGTITATGSNQFRGPSLVSDARYTASFDATYVSGGQNLEFGKGFVVVATITPAGNGGVKTRYSYEFVADGASLDILDFGGVAGGVWNIDNVTCNLVTPSWYPTDPAGADIWPSTTIRTRQGNRKKYDATYLGYFNDPAATTVLTRPTSGVLPVNNFGIWFRCVPSTTGQATVDLFGCRTDASNYFEIYMNATQVRFYKVVAGAFAGPVATYTHTADTPFEGMVVQTPAGMEIRVKQDGGLWSEWVADVTATAQLDAVVAETYQIGGDGAGGSLVDGNIPNTIIIRHGDPKAELERLAVLYP